MEIDVYSSDGGGGTTASTFYHINLKFAKNVPDEGDVLYLTCDKEINLQAAFPAFMRYKTNGRNGYGGEKIVIDPYTHEERDKGNRPKKAKWYAFKYDRRRGQGVFYDTASMLTLYEEDGNNIYHSYVVQGRYNNGTTTSFINCLKTLFVDDEYYTITGKEQDITKVGASNDEYEHIAGINNCGIALVDKYGKVVSNIARMKMFLGSRNGDMIDKIFLYPMYDK